MNGVSGWLSRGNEVALFREFEHEGEPLLSVGVEGDAHGDGDALCRLGHSLSPHVVGGFLCDVQETSRAFISDRALFVLNDPA